MTLRMRVLPRFPARIAGINGISTYRDGPDLVIESDYGSLIRIPAVDNQATTFFKVWNEDDDSYSIMTFEDVIAAIGTISGFMEISAYDPQGKNTDVFAYADAGKAAALAAAATAQTAANTAQATANAALPKAGGVMTGVIQDALFAPSTAATKISKFDNSAITAGQTRNIRVPDGDSYTGLWEPIGPGSGGFGAGVYSFNAVAQLVFTGLANYDMLRLSGSIANTVAATMALVTSSNNGVSYDGATSDYLTQLFNVNGTAAVATVASTTNIAVLFGSQTLDANNLNHLQLDFYRFNKAQVGRVRGRFAGVVSGAFFLTDSVGSRQQSTARNAFKIAPSSGLISGLVTLEGVRG